MNPIFTYLAPPLVGAFIGYMTNYVAIRMLFRPLKAWRFLGIRVPMTPGVIPSKRADLAVNIGKMVGSHLLTSKDVSKAISGNTFRLELQGIVNNRIESILQKKLGTISSIIPKRFRTSFEAGIKIMRWRSLRVIHNHIDSDSFAQKLAASISTHLQGFLEKDLNSTLPKESRDQFFNNFNTIIHNLLASPEAETLVQGYISDKADEILASKQSLQDLMPRQLTEIIVNLVQNEAPALLAKAAQMTSEPAAREKIIQGICTAIQGFIAGLGAMAAMASSFLSAELIETKVREYLDEKGEEIGQWLTNDEVQQKISTLLKEKVELLLQKPIADLADGVETKSLNRIKTEVGSQIIKALRTPQTTTALTEILRTAIETQAKRPINETLEDMFGKNGVRRGKIWTAEEIINIIRSRQVKQILDNLVINLVEKRLIESPIGALNNFLPKNVQSGIGEYALQQTTDLLVREVPGLVDSLNIEQIVTKKVNSLDLLHLEELLLSIMQEQFKYINLFGGLLGFIIGLLNLVFILG